MPGPRRGRSSPSFTPDGRQIIVPNFRASNVSIVDFDPATAARRVSTFR